MDTNEWNGEKIPQSSICLFITKIPAEYPDTWKNWIIEEVFQKRTYYSNIIKKNTWRLRLPGVNLDMMKISPFFLKVGFKM